MDNPKSNYKFEDFPVGQQVKVISKVVDFTFFYGDTGKVVKNNGKYLGITVEFDKPRVYENGKIEYIWNFNPNNLEPISTELKKLELQLDKEEFEKAIRFYIKETYGWCPDLIIPNADHNGEIELIHCES